MTIEWAEYVICESPNLEDDARLLQNHYINLHNKNS